MKSILCLMACVCLMGVSCEPAPVTITVQYVNTLDIQVTLQAVDAKNTQVSSVSLAAKAVADPVQITGVPPFIFSAPFQLGDAGCSVPVFIGDDTFTQYVWRVESTADMFGGAVIECVNDQGTVRHH